jgi:hypothetical protein
MEIMNHGNQGSILIGSGFLYAQSAATFDMANFNTDNMTEIGYINDSAKFTRTHESKDIETANYGVVDTYNSKYTTSFETGVISYNAENIAQFLTGDDYVAGTAAQGKITNKTYFVESAKTPTVALVFVGTDEESGEQFKLVMPKCKWVGDYELDFNNDNPVALNYNFKCFNVTLPNNKTGAAWIEETVNAE